MAKLNSPPPFSPHYSLFKTNGSQTAYPYLLSNAQIAQTKKKANLFYFSLLSPRSLVANPMPIFSWVFYSQTGELSEVV